MSTATTRTASQHAVDWIGWWTLISQTDARQRWQTLSLEFLCFHRRPLNNLLHGITTPVSLVGLQGLLVLAHPSLLLWTLPYLAVLWFWIPAVVFVPTAAIVLGSAAIAYSSQLGLWVSLGLFLGGYFGQDLAHLLTGERTYQSSYSRTGNRWMHFVWHLVYQVPLVVLSCLQRTTSPLRMLVQRKAIHFHRLQGSQSESDLQSIRQWATELHPSPSQSVHYWPADMQGDPKAAFDRLAVQPDLMRRIRRFHGAGYEVAPVFGMNELYVTGPPKRSTSDTVFYMSHVDGPFSVFPGARLYRCMVATSPNTTVTTHFPMVGAAYDQPESFRLETGQTVAFDFNRELHYITRDASADQVGPRVNLKLHFVAYPKVMRWYGKLLDRWTTSYDIKARNLFLQTIAPDALFSRWKAQWVLASTKFYEWAVRYVGWTNVAYVALVAIIAACVGDYRWFVLATSFVHYLIYLGTLRERRGVAFGLFVRDAIFFKAVAMAQLIGLFAWTLLSAAPSTATIAIAVVTIGFSLSGYAAHLLGLRRTYFSSELGLDPPKRIDTFPYGYIPHPMIAGTLLALAGIAWVAPVGGFLFWVAVIHSVFYLCVLLHEIVVHRERTGHQSTADADGVF
ncbi:methyltransferase [Crateriforma spongiae]|uniref:methyltransferase n=1 Tax=Crateriforma spongiae TaxID=2724528 RepID=UPI0014468327|nr:methyltransferase [Crateriforma spongiae]